MKKRVLPVLLTVLFILPLAAGCTPTEEITTDTQKTPDTEAQTTGAVTVTETETETETEPESETEVVTEEPKAGLKDGMMIYYENFDNYGDVNGAQNVMAALNWQILNTSDHAPNDWTAELYLKDGALVVENYSDQFAGNDSFALMLTDEYMDKAVKYGRYTLQYDVTYTGASNYKRYMNVVTEYNGDSYNSFIYRICGYGNNQCYFYGDWFTYDSTYEDDAFAAQKTNTEQNTTIAYKLLGIESDVAVDSAINNFKDVTVTIRVCRDVKAGCTVYMKTADMKDFVLVSKTDEFSDATAYTEDLTGRAVCFKAGGKINGRMDNIAMWLGFGEMPADTTVTYTP